MHRLLFVASDWRLLRTYFEDAGSSEAGAFLLIRAARSASGARVLVQRVLLPTPGDFERQGPDALRPSGRWLSASLGAAIEAHSGLAFIHSHPDPAHIPALSPLDHRTSREWAQSLSSMLDGPFASLVWSPRGVAGVLFPTGSAGKAASVDRVASLGDGRVEVLNPMPPAAAAERELDDRQVRALTALGNTRLRQLDVGVVGLGGTGSPLAEQLVRMGVAGVTLVDPDLLDTSNLRRVVGGRASDIGKSKVEVVARHLDSLGLTTRISAMSADVRQEEVVRRLLDCDIVVSSTDTQSSRALLNQVAYQAWLPIVDVGLRIGTARSGAISGMPVEARILLPDNGCLWCRGGVLDSQGIYEENLPAEVREGLAEEGYVQGVRGPQPSIAPLNWFAASLAALTVIHLYADRGPPHASVIVDGWEQYVHFLSANVDPQCICAPWRGQADDLPMGFLPPTK